MLVEKTTKIDKKAVGCILTFNNKYFLAQRTKNRRWNSITGNIEKEDINPEKAIRRELKEELALIIKPNFLTTTYHNYNGKIIEYYLFYYKLSQEEHNAIQLNEEHINKGLFTLKEALQLNLYEDEDYCLKYYNKIIVNGGKMKKIYFAGAIRGGRDDAKLYAELISHLKKYGKVLTEHIGYSNLSHLGENMTNSEIHDRDITWLNESSFVVAEISTPSLGVGYELGRALEKGKTILCLYQRQKGKKVSAMIAGSKSITCKEYTNLRSAKDIIDNFFTEVQ